MLYIQNCGTDQIIFLRAKILSTIFSNLIFFSTLKILVFSSKNESKKSLFVERVIL